MKERKGTKERMGLGDLGRGADAVGWTQESEPDPSAASDVQVQDDSERWGRQGVASQPQATL